ncbi:hypothetical protein FQN57_003879 [Myotisia sp. PD_48]|nr:hypothetical protein FQN57_003879 [Myotisia sp. PD_48]
MADIHPQDTLQYYHLPSEFPEEWPTELDQSDDSEDEAPANANENDRRLSRIRYSGLRASRKESVSNGYRSVQNDEPDPLGGPESIIRMLKHRGLPVDSDRIRNQYLLSSTNFSPTLFLSETQASASTQSLLLGLDHLSKSIDQKSSALKKLVESNFERFVRVKATLDNVYTEMKDHGANSDINLHRSNSRETHRSGSYIGSTSGGLWQAVGGPTARKAGLNHESEYGVLGIRIPLAQVSTQAKDLWGEALDGRQHEEHLKLVLNTIEKHREIHEIGADLSRAIQERDYDVIFDKYNKARRYAHEAKLVADHLTATQKPPKDEQIYTILATGRMWMDTEKQIQVFKRDLWKRLSHAQSTSSTHPTGGQVDDHMELISALLELGVEDNPIWVWLLSRYDYLKTRINSFCQQAKVEIEILRRHLATGKKPDTRTVAWYLRISGQEGQKMASEQLDTDSVIDLWECVHMYLKKLLAVQGGLLGDVLGFWAIAQSFMDGTKQQLLPGGFEGESRQHHRLSASGVSDLKDGIIELMGLIRENVVSLFSDPPPEELTPLPPSPHATSPTPYTGITSPESQFKLDPHNIPPVPEKRGDPWEEFAFWPPYSNSLSGVHYLSQFLILIGTAASEMADMSPISSSNSAYEKLKLLVSVARERCARASCAAWNNDAELCKYLEDWTRDPNNKDLSKMPGHFMAFESTILAGMQKILYISEAMTKPGVLEVVAPPPAKLLQMVRAQFVTSVYKALSGVVENAEHPIPTEDPIELVLPGPDTNTTGLDAHSSMFTTGSVDSKNRNVRVLLTLSNLRTLRVDHVPRLVSIFESSFTVKLTDESKTIQDILAQIDSRLFQSYLKPIADSLKSIIRNGIASPDWTPSTSRPDHIRPYVYETMLSLVTVHTQVTTTLPMAASPSSGSSSSASLAHAILSKLLTHISNSLLEAFTQRQSYTLPSLMQATLDTEFIAQTMSQYSTDAASKVQSQIYLELDRRTNNEARAKLQAELGEMRGVLKRLREATRGEFACFRKPRSSGTAR